jgi:hypothetical protein
MRNTPLLQYRSLQQLLTDLWNLGFSDTAIARFIGCRPETIARVRSGEESGRNIAQRLLILPMPITSAVYSGDSSDKGDTVCSSPNILYDSLRNPRYLGNFLRTVTTCTTHTFVPMCSYHVDILVI